MRIRLTKINRSSVAITRLNQGAGRRKFMDNQHKKIKGYRDLSQQEIDLMNKIKEHAEGARILIEEVRSVRDELQGSILPPLDRKQYGESMDCLENAKTNLQQGYMWFVRSVALPETF